MANFGSQTSTYNKLVTIFVAIGSLVSDPCAERPLIVIQLSLTCHMDRRTATAPRSSAVLSVSLDGTLTSIFLGKASLDMTRSQQMQLPLPMESSAREERSVRSS